MLTFGNFSSDCAKQKVVTGWLSISCRCRQGVEQSAINSHCCFQVAALIRYRRKQSGSGIRTIIRIGLKSESVRPCPDICRHATFHPNPCTRFWVILLTDRQTLQAIACTSSFVRGNETILLHFFQDKLGEPVPEKDLILSGVWPGFC